MIFVNRHTFATRREELLEMTGFPVRRAAGLNGRCARCCLSQGAVLLRWRHLPSCCGYPFLAATVSASPLPITPEIEGKCRDEIKRAIEARDYTRALVAGKVVTLTA
jgi:hypothetical protein